MKKITLTLIFGLIAFLTNAQITQTQSLGSKNTLVVNRGIFKSDSALQIATRDTLNHPYRTLAGTITRRPQDSSLYITNGSTWGKLSNDKEIKNLLNGKQPTLIAGTNITIAGNTISATGGGGSTTTGEGVEIVAGVANLGGSPFSSDRILNLGNKSLVLSKPNSLTTEPFIITGRRANTVQNAIIISDSTGLGYPSDVPLEICHWNQIQPNGSNNNTMSIGLNTNNKNPNMIGMGIFMEPNWDFGGVQWIENHYELLNVNNAVGTKRNLRLWSSQYQHRSTLQASSHVFDYRGTIFSFKDLFDNDKFNLSFGGNNSTTMNMELGARTDSRLNLQSASNNIWQIGTPDANQDFEFNNWGNVRFHSFYDSKQYDQFVFKKDAGPNGNSVQSLGFNNQRFKNIWATNHLGLNMAFGEKAFFEAAVYNPPAALYGVAVGNTSATKLVSFKGYNNASVILEILENNAVILGLPVYADNAAAITGGLLANQMYKTSTGELRIRY